MFDWIKLDWSMIKKIVEPLIKIRPFNIRIVYNVWRVIIFIDIVWLQIEIEFYFKLKFDLN